MIVLPFGVLHEKDEDAEMVQHYSVHLLGSVSLCFTTLIPANGITIQTSVTVYFLKLVLCMQKRNPSYRNTVQATLLFPELPGTSPF